MRVKRVIWDFNGTLLNDLDTCFECVNILLGKYAKSHGCRPFESIGEYKKTFGFPIEDYYRRAGFDFEKTSYDMLAHEFMELYYAREPFAPLSDGVVKTLETLKNAGIKQTVLSASRLTYLKTQLEKRSIIGYFDEVLGISDIYAASKLHIAEDWIKRIGENPAEMLMVGDTPHDAETAAVLGCPCVLFTGGHQSLDGYEGVTAERIEDICGIVLNDEIV